MSRLAGSRRPREAAWAALFFVAATVLMTWPQVIHLGDRMNDLWDAKQNAWILHWDFQQTFRDPARLFQAPILHPARYALAFSENLYGAAVFGFPLLALGVPIVVNYNVVFLLGMAFSAWSAWLLARYVTGDAAASLVAGLVYAFVPWRFTQLPHINMQWGGFLCLLFLFLLRYLDAGRRRDLALFGICFAGNLLATLHFGLFSGFLVGVALVFEGFGGGKGRARRILMVLAAAAAATLACAPFLVPYRMAETLYGMRRNLEDMEFFSAKPSDFLSAGRHNRLYGALTFRWSRGTEGDLFPGLMPLLLATAAVLGLWRRRGETGTGSAAHRLRLDRRAALLVCVCAVGLVVALGAHTPFYRFFFLNVGSVFRAIRVPARGIVLFHMALGVLAAWGLSLVTRRLGRRPRVAWIGAAVVLLTFEYRAFPLDLFEYDASPRPVYMWLRAEESSGAVVEWPLGFPYDPEWMLRQAEHGRPLVNGHQSYFPPAYAELLGTIRGRPIPPAIWGQVDRLGAETLVYHAWGISYDRVRYRRLLREGLAVGRLRPLRVFRDGDETTLVFRLGHAGPEIAAAGLDPAFRRALEELETVSDADAAPPTGLVHAPIEGQTVAPGFWGFGWAVDDSGIAEIRIGSELGPGGVAQLGGKWPGLAETFPDLPGSAHGGFGFPVPQLPAGPHMLKIRLVGQDGGETVLERRIVVEHSAIPAKP